MNLFRVISNLLRFDRTNWTALVLCLFAAVIFWVFTALNKTYSTNISFPLAFDYDGDRYAPAEPLPPKLIVNVSGNGWELLRKNLGLKVPTITFPLERPTEVRKIVGSTLSPHVVSQLGVLQLNFIAADTLRILIEPRISRKVKLLADLNAVSFKKNFGIISPVVILPDSVVMDGPKSFIGALRDTLWLKVTGNRLSSHFRESMEVKVDNNEFISRNPPVAEVLFEVGPVEEVTTHVKLTKPRMPSGAVVEPDSIRCTLLISQKDRERLLADISLLSVTFLYPDVKRGDTLVISPLVSGVPEYARLVSTDSIHVRKP